MIPVTRTIALDEKEIKLVFVRSSGPGGQNVNKVATAVQLRFDILQSPSLPDDVRRRLVRLAGKRLNAEGILIIEAHRFRTQEHNRRDVLERLIALIRTAAQPPIIRHKTKPSRASQKRRLEAKRRRSRLKNLRGPVSRFEE